MNTEQVRRFVLDYLEATDCHILEVSPASITVKLSERADRKLTNRPYYWSFVDRTGAEPETMRFTFLFDPASMPPDLACNPYSPSLVQAGGNAPQNGAPAVPSSHTTADVKPDDSILSRYFGVAPAFTGSGVGLNRIPREEVTFGSRRLTSIMQAAYEEGRFVSLFAEHGEQHNSAVNRTKRGTRRPTAYEPWLLLNLKVEFACDLKREEIHSYGISLVNGRIHTTFIEQLLSRPLSPKLPPNVHVAPWRLSLEQAHVAIEEHLTRLISTYDDTWATQATERLEEELARLHAYYSPQLQQSGPLSEPQSEQAQIRQQYDMRSQEIRWQFEPRIIITMLNSGLIHLPSTTP